MSYTKGPWRVEGNDIRCNPQEDDTGTFVAEMVSSIAPNETKSNSILIAAAPDLLEACKYAFDNLKPQGNVKKDFSGHNAMATLSRAIAKAEGRE